MSNWFRTYGFADVHDGLLVGSYPLDASDVSVLDRLGVRRVLNLAEDSEYAQNERSAVAAALQAAGIAETRISLEDHGSIPAEALELAVETVCDWLNAGQTTYVHCRAGWQRSAAVAAGVVALREGLPITAALDRVKIRKPSARPLPHQLQDLLRWWDWHNDGTAEAFRSPS
ncbi:MAG: dual specificity protein phosphatase family protein [Actinomycetota bacterium]|nr:dual specificity protein phosphatase family protein [Actinomycetota bacterium]